MTADHHDSDQQQLLEQCIVRLTPHPLQRVGAFALAALADCRDLTELTAARFDEAVERMTADCVRAAKVGSTKDEDGFWLKTSYSFFPNSKMNHPSRWTRTRAERERAQATAGAETVVEKGRTTAELEDAVRQWRRMPDRDQWPSEPCALCEREAVGFYGNVDVPLALSISLRNTTPPGHGGLALSRSLR